MHFGLLKEAKWSRKKNSSLNGRAIKRGGGVKFRATKEKKLFFNLFSNVSTAIMLKALMAQPLGGEEPIFFSASLN